MKKVLITGASGFVGRQCIPMLLAQGYEVHAVTITPVDPIPKLHWHILDLLNLKDIEALITDIKPTHLLHLAWNTAPGIFWTSPENIRWTQASLELLQTFSAQGGTRVVMAGTCAEYEWKNDVLLESTTPLKPKTLYGASKHALQTILEAFSKQTGLSSAWGRIFFLYGPYEHPDRLVSSVIRSLIKGEPARCSHGNQIRDFLHVEDVASAFVKLLDSKLQGAVNIGSGIPTTIGEIVETIGTLMDEKELIQLGALPTPKNEPAALIADVQRLTSIGWKPRYDISSGIAQTIEWWKTNIK